MNSKYIGWVVAAFAMGALAVNSVADAAVATETHKSVKRKSLEPEATKRLADGPRVITAVFEASGRGNWRKSLSLAGGVASGSYNYTTVVKARSEIISKDERPGGEISVTERRKFLEARDIIALSELDASVKLDMMEVDKLHTWATGIGGLISYFNPGVGGSIIAGSEVTFQTLAAIDGASVRRMLGDFNLTVPANLENWINSRLTQIVSDNIKTVHNAIQSIEGKCFLISYKQDASGQPLSVDFENEDGSPISEAEWEILRTANCFLDGNVVPNSECSVGDEWTVYAEEMEMLFGAAGDGRVSGHIKVRRTENASNGDWTLEFDPAKIMFLGDDGTSCGRMKIKKGNGLVDANTASARNIQALGEGAMRKLNEQRHYLFIKYMDTVDGDASLRFTLDSSPADAERK